MEWYIGDVWQDSTKGLSKTVLGLEFSQVEKPLMISTVQYSIKKACVNLGTRSSKLLASSADESVTSQPHTLEMGTSLTPIDCYVELLLQQFVVGETAACTIQTKCGETLEFQLKLERIIENVQVHKLDAGELYKIALRYKENGVAMFKAYPIFALDYFVKAAKLLITYKPFDQLTLKSNGIEGKEVEALFVQIQTNLAACLLKEERYEHVVYHTEFVETMENPSEKSVYRRALAFYNLKEYEKAQRTIERIPNYKEKREFCKLLDNIAASWKHSDAHYKEVMQRMFS